MVQNDADVHPFGDAFDVKWYIRTYRDVPQDTAAAARHFMDHGLAEGRRFHPLFDAEWYLRQNPDVAATAIAPTRHFLEHGLSEGRSPHPLFDPSWYQSAHPEVQRSKLSPFIHFLRHGLQNDLSPHPIFDPAWYRRRYPDAAKSGLPAVVHYLEYGAAAGYSPHAIFDGAWYARQNFDVPAGYRSPIEHFVSCGFSEGRSPSPLLDADWYRRRYPDVAASEISPVEHFIRYGLKEGRNPHPVFDQQWYLARYPHVAKYTEPPIVYFVEIGLGRGDVPGPLFDKKFYLKRYPDIVQSRSDPLEHYIQYGYTEGRLPNQLFDEDWYKVTYNSSLAPNQPPFLHFIKTGQFDLIDPHPLFHSEWYAQRYCSTLGDDPPYIHYLRHVRNQPNRAFDPGFVAKQLPSLSLPISSVGTEIEGRHAYKAHDEVNMGEAIIETPHKGRSLLEEYLAAPANHNVQPNYLFDDIYYKYTYPDVRHPSSNPLAHFLRYGITEGRRPSRDFDPIFYKLQAGFESYATAFWSALEEGIASNHRPSTAFLPAWDNYILRDLKQLLMNDLPTVLIINHFGGGGTSKNIFDLCSSLSGKINFIILAPGRNGFITLELWDKSFPPLIFDRIDSSTIMVDVLCQLPIDRLHIHHAYGLNEIVPLIAVKMLRPYDVTLHDTYFLTPNPLFRHSTDARDGVGFDQAMRISARNPLEGSEAESIGIEDYRARYRTLLRCADRLIAPSHFIANVYKSCDPTLKPIVVPNIDPVQPGFPIRSRKLSPADRMRVGVIGDLAAYKGASQVQRCALAAQVHKLPLQFTVIGEASHFVKGAGVSVAGRYDDDDLPELLVRYKIDTIWLPYEAPESYSYVLSSALRSSLPVLISDVGCFPERTQGLPQVFMIPVDSCSTSWLDLMMNVRDQIINGASFEASSVSPRDSFYCSEYIRRRP